VKRPTRSIPKVLHWLLLGACLHGATGFAQRTIVYHQPPEPLFGLGGIELDLNGDGQVECRFYNGSYGGFYFATYGTGVGTAQLLVTPQGPFDSASYLLGWNQGYLIGGATNSLVFWAGHEAPNAYGAAFVLGAYLFDVGGFIPDGDFYGTTAFFGIHFQIGSEWHYGWVRVKGGVVGPSDDGQVFYLNPPGWILDWAYEARPDTPILAGAGIDSDHDGVPDELDLCPATPAGAVVDANGCSIDQLCPCDGSWKNHGQYVQTVTKTALRFKREGRITSMQASGIIHQAAASGCGKHQQP